MSESRWTGPDRRGEGWAGDERYQQLVELAPDGILIHDGERIVLANAAAVRLAGATYRAQLVGLPIATFLDPPYLKGVENQLLQPGEPVEVEQLAPPVRDTFHRLDGSEIAVEVRSLAFMDRGHPSAHLVVRDITERLGLEQAARQAEERLQQAQKMEAVGALAGGVAHEINNMMTVVLGFSEMLLGDLDLPAERLRDVQEMAMAAGHAATITRQLLAFSRRDLHRPRAVDLDATVHDLEPTVRRLLGEGRRLALASDAAPRVWADKGQLEQVIVNLALNARDAMPAGGTLTLTVAANEISGGATAADGTLIPAGHYALLGVRDTGAGMGPATLARIFEPFFTTKPFGQGTGLGLAAVYGLMKQNGGYVMVASAPGEGAAFTLYLPVFSEMGEVESRRELPPVAAAPTSAGTTVLVVEDERAVRIIAARILEQGGFRVLQAGGGAAAFEVVERDGPPDVLLTDLMMPGITGADLARRLKERWPELPVVFMTGYSVADLLRDGAAGTGGMTLQKPFTPAALLAAVMAAAATGAVSAPVRHG